MVMRRATARMPSSLAPEPSYRKRRRANRLDARGVVDSLRQNDLAAAQEGANKLIKSDPKNPVGYNMLGGVQAGRRDYAAARKSFEQALALDRDYSPASMNLAQLDMLQKDYATARRRYDAVLAKEPTNVSAMLGLSRIEFTGNNSQDGVRWLERAKTTDPAAWMPRLLLVRHRLANGEVQAAITELTDARRKQPDNPGVLVMLGPGAASQWTNGRCDRVLSAMGQAAA